MGKNAARQLGLCIALAAMLFRAFLPEGWMPAPRVAAGDAAWPAFVICTSHGLDRLHDGPGSTRPGGDHSQRYAPCAYAAAVHLATPVVGVAVALYETAFVSAPLSTTADILVAKTLFQRQRSRAPPFLNI
jgi:hypothetical protein